MKMPCKHIQTGLKTNTNLAQDRIERLEKIDSVGSSSTMRYSRSAAKIKEEFGHYTGTTRTSYHKKQMGMETMTKLSQDRTTPPEEIDFKWQKSRHWRSTTAS